MSSITGRQIQDGRLWAALLAGLTAVSWLGWTVATWPRVAPLAATHPAASAFMTRDAEAGVPVQWQWVPLEGVSPHLLRAVIVAEDIEFFSHGGFSASELRAAISESVRDGAPLRGASTITQQLAKNLWLSSSRTAGRKLHEAILTWQLERTLSKRRILELYVNFVQFGPGIYGVEAAAQRYFDKPAAGLTPEEAAQLAAGLPRPSTWNPASRSDTYGTRVQLVLARMDRAQFLWERLGIPRPPAVDRILPADSFAPLSAEPPSPDTVRPRDSMGRDRE